HLRLYPRSSQDDFKTRHARSRATSDRLVYSLKKMDVLYFLKERTRFIRQFYELAAGPFLERKRKIEDGEEPFEPPYVDEYSSGEPAYLEEWMEADESLHVLAYACISMLAAALQLYFTTWERQFRKAARDLFKTEFKDGWLAGYKSYFAEYVGISFESCP